MAPDRSPMLLALTGVGRRFAGRPWVLQNIDLQVSAGERVVLVGDSGVGKSTLLNLCAGLDQPDQGVVRLQGHDLAALDDTALSALRSQALGFVFQAFHLIPHLSVAQNVALPLILNGASEAEAAHAVTRLLGKLGLAGRENDAPGLLSGGEQQRVALARALIHRPALVLADEPTGNLDPRTARTAIDLLDAQVREHGAALLLVTHSAQAERIADRLLRLTGDGLTG